MTPWQAAVFLMLGLVSTLGLTYQPTYSQNESSSSLPSLPSLLPAEWIYYDGLVNVTVQYPDNWIEAEPLQLEYPAATLLYPEEFLSERVIPVTLGISIILPGDNPNTNLTELAENILAGFKEETSFRIINHTSTTNAKANITLSNGTQTLPAFIVHMYDFSKASVDYQKMFVVTVVNDEHVTMFEYSAEKELFDEYFPQAQKILQSIKFTYQPK